VYALFASGGPVARKIVDSNEQSDFLQLVSTQKLKMDHGNANVPVTASATGSLVINHGLGVTPSKILITTAASNYFGAYSAQTPTTFTAYVQESNNAVGTGSIPISWLAFA
jgi:carbamoylphosphate synthase small subunit